MLRYDKQIEIICTHWGQDSLRLTFSLRAIQQIICLPYKTYGRYAS